MVSVCACIFHIVHEPAGSEGERVYFQGAEGVISDCRADTAVRHPDWLGILRLTVKRRQGPRLELERLHRATARREVNPEPLQEPLREPHLKQLQEDTHLLHIIISRRQHPGMVKMQSRQHGRSTTVFKASKCPALPQLRVLRTHRQVARHQVAHPAKGRLSKHMPAVYLAPET